MTKRYDEPIEVTPDPYEKAAPISFSWRGRRYDVDQRLGEWRTAGDPRNGGGDLSYYRLLAHPAGSLATGDLDSDGFLDSRGAVYDVYEKRGTWRLARIWD